MVRVPLPSDIGAIWRDNPDGASLVGTVELTTDDETTVAVTVDDGVTVRTLVETARSTTHSVLVLGLRPDTRHELVVTATGSTFGASTLVVDTPPLPEDFPPLDVLTADPARMEPGVTILSIGGYLLMVDADGVPAWYMPNPSEYVHQVAWSPRGTLMMNVERTDILELSLTGALLRRWSADPQATEGAIPVDVEAFHHDFQELPDGNLLTLSIEARQVLGYPSSEDDPAAPPADAEVAGDVVVELEPDGTVVHRWSLLDRLDPLRIGYGSVRSEFWEDFYQDGVMDWSHGNAVGYDPVRDEVLVSLRHQDAVVGLGRATGELEWIFAPEASWDPVRFGSKLIRPADPAAIVPYHMHGVKLGPGGTLLMFDNGNARATPYAPPISPELGFSRGLEVVIDHPTHTWSPSWQFGQDLVPSRFSNNQGDVDALPQTGNRLVSFGNIIDEELPGVELFEVTTAPNPEVVWHLVVPDRAGTRFLAYRAERLTGVIPGR